MEKEVSAKIGILGGTFNPIHNGHLMIAEQAREEFGLERILFLPTGQSPHKLKQQITDSSMRCDMIRLAIADNPFFELDMTEVNAKRISYTYITLQEIKKAYPASELYFILGADSLFDLETWKEPEEIFAACNILAAYREGDGQKDFQKQIDYLNEKYHAHIYPLHTPSFEVSSREIRSRVSKNQTIRYLVPKEVGDYIQKTKLYRNL